ncbi:1-aminocyclopropane-1-carboxylate oxidase 1 [Ananas comosus]|uniref:1-aminocyclopropane-1-carboxylate oxidase 1 n=1 Tax=Ananas comosus TaxID=4615 RepID=A0A199VB26_ANACO|nr:1-aminocyclopropane-1-carboxylate oxidase 1 [Ananas comosus]
MDCLQDWPEPVVRVQSISESGAQSIPERYVKPPSERPSDTSVCGDSGGAGIPVIDLSMLGRCSQTVRAVSDACREWGFFQVVNHGVSAELMRRARAVWKGFFHQPMDVKQRYANSPKTYEGYGLGLEEGRLGAAFGGEEVGVCMRVNFYSKCPQPELTLGLSSHSDPGGITVLLVDDRVKGLQVRKDGAWVTVQPIADAFIVNVGDQIQVLSNAVYRSVEHRVLVSATDERLSMAFFYNPRSDLPLAPVPELVTPDRPALYQPMTFDEYRLFIRKRGPRGKSQVESLKTVE